MSEDEQITSSLTKGCFLFKPAKDKSPKKKTRKDESNDAISNPVNYYSTIKHEVKQERHRRYECFEKCWKNLNEDIEEVLQDLNNQIFDDLLHFVTNAYKIKKSNICIDEIPTAALITGVNLPDHDVVFTRFMESLKSSVTKYAVMLHSKNCNTLKSILKVSFDGLCESMENEENMEKEELTLNTSRSRSNKIFKDYSFQELKEWYEKDLLTISQIIDAEEMELEVNNQYLSESMEPDQAVRPPIVFIFQDFERFSPMVIQDFILIASEYVKEVPIVFIFGVATTIAAVHRFLPHNVSSNLSIEKFQAKPSLECLTEVIDQVLLSNKHAFKLGPNMFRLLYEHFLYHDFSINNFVKALKFSVMDHFYENEFSVMCTKDRNEIKDYVNRLSEVKLKRLKEIDSFKQFIDRKSEKEQKKLQNNATFNKQTIIKLVEELQKQEKLFYPIVKCFHVAAAKLPGHPFGKRLRDTYEYLTIKPNITNESKYRNTIILIRMLSRIELGEILRKSADIMIGAISNISECKVFSKDIEKIEDLIIKMDDLEKGLLDIEMIKTYTPALTSKTPPATKIFKNRFEFTEKMKSSVKEKRNENPFERLRNEIVDFLDGVYKKYLRSPFSMTFNEIFYYNEMDYVKKRINGTPRVAIQRALADPHFYLQCNCCQDTKNEIHDSQPDISILYKLHLECAKLVNLYDWLQAFITVTDPSLVDTKKKKSKQKKKLEEQLQARFIRGVSELQYLGFIKSTRRKTDHVARLTWGSC